jgi:hypothetical protein
LRDYAAANGYRVNREVLEIASGLNDQRPKFGKLGMVQSHAIAPLQLNEQAIL